MQKKKIHKATKATKFNPDDLPPAFFEDIMGDFTMGGANAGHAFGQMLSSTMSATIELAKLVIENRVRNAEHMIDDDIYGIYKKSFAVTVETAPSGSDDQS